jgi:hypothetical protein
MPVVNSDDLFEGNIYAVQFGNDMQWLQNLLVGKMLKWKARSKSFVW